MDRKVKGYNILELLFIISLVIILGYIGLREFQIYMARERLKIAAEELLSTVKLARSQSVIGPFHHGIFCRNTTNDWIYFRDLNRNTFYDNGEEILISALTSKYGYGIRIVNTSTVFLFDRTGQALSTGRFGNCTLENAFGERIRVTVDSVGRITIQRE
ncbi:MAG: GspH/FimT family protein [Thermodesulfobacterium sp.]|nr:GspH/FimT family protein [Thermodesulfobacterium sp.]